MTRSRMGSVLLTLAVALGSPADGLTQEDKRGGEPDFPAEARILVDGAFRRCEGIAFSGEGVLYVAGNAALWRVETTGEVTKIADMYSNLGLAPIGGRDILMADFGPTNRFDLGPNSDGIVWRVTPEGDATRAVDGGIGDPNFVMVLADGSFLVTDDATDEILWVGEDGQPRLLTDAVGHPNGLALSSDGRTLYVAQIFESLRPMVTSGKVWKLPFEEGDVAGLPQLLADLGDGAANDGLALDEHGRVYVAANGFGQIWRVDPSSGESVLIAENMPGAASIAFGRGAFDHEAIYVTSTRTGRVWEVGVGSKGAALHH
jgi:sugar lactone lactonase YvrE